MNMILKQCYLQFLVITPSPDSELIFLSPCSPYVAYVSSFWPSPKFLQPGRGLTDCRRRLTKASFCILLCKVNPDLREKIGQASQKPSNVYMGRRTAAFSGHIKLFVTLCLKKLLLSETQHTPVLVG